jgi:putative hemolysin
LIKANHFSRYPVMRENDKDVVGVVEVKWLMDYLGSDQPINLFNHIAKPAFVPESMSAVNLIEQLRDAEVFMAFVVDEYGDLQGIVTLNDLLHAVVGSSSQANKTASGNAVVQRADGSYLIDGALSVEDLRELMEVHELPHEDEHDFNTLAGMLMAQFGRIPSVADVFEWRGWRFEVVDLDGARVDKIMLSRLDELSE